MTKEQLKKLRIKLGYSQRQFAEELGLPVRTYQGYELGRNIPGPVAKLAKKIPAYKGAQSPQWVGTNK